MVNCDYKGNKKGCIRTRHVMETKGGDFKNEAGIFSNL